MTKDNTFVNIFKGVFSGALGFISAYALIGLFSLTFVVIGLYLINTYNKKDTELLKDIQPTQYLGIVFCIIGCLPFAQYFFMGFLSQGGRIAMDNLMNN